MMPAPAPSAPPEIPQDSLRLHALLRKAGIRPTFHRLQVLQVLDAVAPRALTAEQVYQELAALDVVVSQGTVYRVLSEFDQHDLLVRARLHDASDNKVRYAMDAQSLASACTFTCPLCASAVTVTDTAFASQLQRQALACGFNAQPGVIHIAMTCNRCA